MEHKLATLLLLGVGLGGVLLSIFSVSLAAAGHVCYRSVKLQKEIATRRVLGARRTDIARQLLIESVAPLIGMALVSSLTTSLLMVLLGVTSLGIVVVLCTSAVITLVGALSMWIAARSASQTPFRRSGLFAASTDKRGE